MRLCSHIIQPSYTPLPHALRLVGLWDNLYLRLKCGCSQTE